MSYAQARKLRGSRLTFERFSSLLQCDELPELLHVGDVSLEPCPAVSIPSAPEASSPRGRAADLENQELHAHAPRTYAETTPSTDTDHPRPDPVQMPKAACWPPFDLTPRSVVLMGWAPGLSLNVL